MNTSMTCCTLGARPDIETITKAMLPVDQGGEGLTIRAVMTRFRLTKNRVERHLQCTRGVKAERLEPKSERRPKTEAKPDTGQDRTARPDKPASDSAGNARAAIQAAETTPDRQSRTPTGQAGQAPDGMAREGEHPEHLVAWQDRVLYVADLIVSNRYRGFDTVRWLCRIWNCSRDTVHEYHRSAALLCEDDRGTRLAKLHTCVAACEVLRDEAKGEGDFRAAASIQSEINKMLGLHPQNAAVNVNVNNPVYDQIFGLVARVLDAEDEHGVKRYPGALQAVERAVHGYLAARRGELRAMVPALAAAS